MPPVRHDDRRRDCDRAVVTLDHLMSVDEGAGAAVRGDEIPDSGTTRIEPVRDAAVVAGLRCAPRESGAVGNPATLHHDQARAATPLAEQAMW